MTLHVTSRIRLTAREFEEMRVDASPENLCAPPYTLRKVQIDGRWHACDRQYQFGQPVHFARPIVVIAPRGP